MRKWDVREVLPFKLNAFVRVQEGDGEVAFHHARHQRSLGGRTEVGHRPPREPEHMHPGHASRRVSRICCRRPSENTTFGAQSVSSSNRALEPIERAMSPARSGPWLGA